jgi:hypothetical protein
MNIPTLARLRRIDIRMRVHPNNRHLPSQSLPNRLRSPTNCTNGDRMVAPEGEDTAAFFCMRVDLFGESLRDGRYSEGVLHPAEIGVGSWHKVFVGVDCVVVVEFVSEFGVELGEETVCDQG